MRTYTTVTPTAGSRLAVRGGADTLAGAVLALAQDRASRLPAQDRDDAAQDIACKALRFLDAEDGSRWSTHGAVAEAARTVLLHYGRDAARQAAREATFDPTDTGAVDALEAAPTTRTRLESWRAVAPDALAQEHDADRLADALAQFLAEAGTTAEYRRRRLIVAAVARMGVRGPLPRVLDADALADMADVILGMAERQAHEDGTWRHATTRSATGRPVVLAWEAAPLEGWARPATLAREASATTHGGPVARATFPMATHAHAGRRKDGRLLAVPCDCVRCKGGDLDADRQADADAERMTPLGAVREPSSRRRKRDGSVGSPTMPVGRRVTWAERTTRSVHEG